MNKMKTLLGSVIGAVALAVVSPAVTGQTMHNGNPQMGPGMMHNPQSGPGTMPQRRGMMGPGHMGGMPPMMQRLNLSPDQREQVSEMMYARRKENFRRMEKMMDLRYKMQKLMNKPAPDPDEVGKVVAQMSEIRREMIESRVAAHNKMRDLLDERQREQFDAMRRGGPGMR